jgi:hypothetical protein
VIIASALLSGCSYVVASPDGSRLYWAKVVPNGFAPSTSGIYAGPTGAAATETLSLPSTEIGSGALAADGSTGYYTAGTTLHRIRSSDLQETGTKALTFTSSTAAMGKDGFLYLVGGNQVSRVDVPAMATETTKASASVTTVISRQAVLTPDGRYLLYSGQNIAGAFQLNRVDTSSLATGTGALVEQTLTPDPTYADITIVILSPDGKSAYLGRTDAIQKVDVESMQVVATYAATTSGDPKASAAIAPDGSRVYFIQNSTPGILTVLDTATMTALAAPALTVPGPGTWLSLNPLGTSLLIGGETGPLETVAVATATTLNVAIAGSGTVSSTTPGIDCGATCTRSYLDYQSVTLTAVASAGSTFTGWTGSCSGATTTCTLPMTEARAVTATFSLPSNAFTKKRTKARATNRAIAISTSLTVPGPGRLKQSVSGVARKKGKLKQSVTGVARKKATLCSTTKVAKRAGTYTLTCLLGAKTRIALSRGAIRLRVATTFAPTGGTARSTTRTVVVPRTPLKKTKPAPPVTG